MTTTKERMADLEKVFPGRGKDVARVIDFASAEATRMAARFVRARAAVGLDPHQIAALLDEVAEELEKP